MAGGKVQTLKVWKHPIFLIWPEFQAKLVLDTLCTNPSCGSLALFISYYIKTQVLYATWSVTQVASPPLNHPGPSRLSPTRGSMFCIIYFTKYSTSKRVCSWCGVQVPGIFAAWRPTFVVVSRYSCNSAFRKVCPSTTNFQPPWLSI